ncbi:MAG: hypothetical protein BGN92_01225 [Sphingobacteriales bacterium 41-5]|nr:MAG: hypothetical protein BGN92_01225 [Sphingobacteriales bacterium 41-5]
MKKNIYSLKKIILFTFSFAILSAAFSQDVIYVNPKEVGRPAPPQPRWMPAKPLKPGAIREDHAAARIIMGSVTEITPAFLFYKKDSDADGTLYTTPVVNIDSVVFANGTVQKFTRESRMPEYKLRDRREYSKLGTNILSGSFGVFTHRVRFLNWSNQNDPDFTPFIKTGFSYEKVLLNDRLGIEIAPFIAINKKGYGGVLQAKFYPKNYGRFRVGMGPFYTLYVRDKATRYFNNVDWYTMTVDRQVAMSVLGFGVQLQSHLDRNWLVAFNANIGGVVGYTDQNKNYPGFNVSSETGTGQGELRLGIGYRF